MLDRLVRGLGRQQDRAAFEGWAPEADGGSDPAGLDADPGEGDGKAGDDGRPSDAQAPEIDARRPAGLFGGT